MARKTMKTDGVILLYLLTVHHTLTILLMYLLSYTSLFQNAKYTTESFMNLKNKETKLLYRAMFYYKSMIL